jgi:hypothetical protein
MASKILLFTNEYFPCGCNKTKQKTKKISNTDPSKTTEVKSGVGEG